MMPRMIATTGGARKGKDTVGDYLVCRYGFQRMSFAGPLKDGLAAMIPDWAAHLQQKEAPIAWLGKSPRELMQTLGTEWGRDMVHPELWLRIATERLAAARAAGATLVVFTDCRFENEAQWIRSMGGSVWHIRRDAAPSVRSHVSEDFLMFDGDCDWIVHNNASIEALYVRIEEIISEMALRP